MLPTVQGVEKLKMSAGKTDETLPFDHVYLYTLECVTDWRINCWKNWCH